MKLVSIIVLILTSCTNAVKELDQDLIILANSINNEFIEVESVAVNSVEVLENIYRNKEKYSLDISKLDKDDGGIFSVFGDSGQKKYFNDTPYMGSLMAILDVEINDEVRKNAAILPEIVKQVINPVMDNYESIGGIFFGRHDPYNIYAIAPHYDPVSVLPVGLATFDNFHWYYRAFEKPSEPVWSEDAFISLAGSTGWMMTVIRDIEIEGESEKGIISVEVWLEKLNKKYILNSDLNLVLLSPSLTVLSVSNRSKELLNFKVIDDFYYLEQLSNNQFLAEEYQLTHKSQTPDFISIGNSIKQGNENFEHEFNGTSFSFIVKDIEKVGFKLLAFIKK